jgi:hypothetical protein
VRHHQCTIAKNPAQHLASMWVSRAPREVCEGFQSRSSTYDKINPRGPRNRAECAVPTPKRQEPGSATRFAPFMARDERLDKPFKQACGTGTGLLAVEAYIACAAATN